MNPSTEIRQFLQQQQTRRLFLGRASQGLGAVALGSILQPRILQAASAARTVSGAVASLHFPAKARRVIWLSMAGGPSHLETFDPKPKLAEMHGKPMPESFTKGKQIAQLQGQKLVCYGPQLPFKRFGKVGVELCELFTQCKWWETNIKNQSLFSVLSLPQNVVIISSKTGISRL